MSLLGDWMNKINFNGEDEDDDYFLDDDYEEDDYDEEEDRKAYSKRPQGAQAPARSGGFLNRKVVPIDSGRDLEVKMIKPETADDFRDVCDYLLAGKAVVLNMEGLNTETARRIIDFTIGAIYAIDGDFQTISSSIFIASPRNVELSGDFQGDLHNMISNKSNTTSQGMGGFAFNV